VDEEDLAPALQRCLATGNKADWEAFIAVAQPIIAAAVLRCVARWTTAGRELVDDLIQETFLKLCNRDFRILRNFRTGDNRALHVYLKTIAGSTVVDHFRAQASEKSGSGKTDLSLNDVADQLVAAGSHAADLERRMLLGLVGKCLEAHAPRNRTIFRLYHAQGMKPKIIASLPGIGMSQSAVETVLYRITLAVRECVKNNGLPQPPARGGREGDLK
jgi:RNA polymerase sigma-70 factor (ECF subfamily)